MANILTHSFQQNQSLLVWLKFCIMFFRCTEAQLVTEDRPSIYGAVGSLPSTREENPDTLRRLLEEKGFLLIDRRDIPNPLMSCCLLFTTPVFPV